jgi:hypothetical protein
MRRRQNEAALRELEESLEGIYAALEGFQIERDEMYAQTTLLWQYASNGRKGKGCGPREFTMASMATWEACASLQRGLALLDLRLPNISDRCSSQLETTRNILGRNLLNQAAKQHALLELNDLVQKLSFFVFTTVGNRMGVFRDTLIDIKETLNLGYDEPRGKIEEDPGAEGADISPSVEYLDLLIDALNLTTERIRKQSPILNRLATSPPSPRQRPALLV